MSIGIALSRRSLLGGLALSGAVATRLAAKKPMQMSGASKRLITYRDDATAATVTTEVLLRGEGPLVVLLPSLGRGASDFDDLASRIAATGFCAAAINPRGIGQSKGPAAQSLADYARDIFEVIKALQSQSAHGHAKPVVLIGHAYGNRLARAVAAAYPDAVSSLILLASGGQVAMAPAVAKALQDVFDPGLSPQAHIEAVRTAFFAPGNDPEIWRDGWYGLVALEQQTATRRTPTEQWAAGGEKPIYIIQAAQDAVATPANAEVLRAAHPDRVEVVVIENAGHAMLPEQGELIAQLVIKRLEALRR